MRTELFTCSECAQSHTQSNSACLWHALTMRVPIGRRSRHPEPTIENKLRYNLSRDGDVGHPCKSAQETLTEQREEPNKYFQDIEHIAQKIRQVQTSSTILQRPWLLTRLGRITRLRHVKLHHCGYRKSIWSHNPVPLGLAATSARYMPACYRASKEHKTPEVPGPQNNARKDQINSLKCNKILHPPRSGPEQRQSKSRDKPPPPRQRIRR